MHNAVICFSTILGLCRFWQLNAVGKQHSSNIEANVENVLQQRNCQVHKLCHNRTSHITQKYHNETSTTLVLDNHSCKPCRSIIMMNHDDDPPSHFTIQSSQQVRPTAECCRKSSLAAWAAVSGFGSAQPSTDRARSGSARPQIVPANNWIPTI